MRSYFFTITCSLAVATTSTAVSAQDNFRIGVHTSDFVALESTTVRFEYDSASYEQLTNEAGLTAPLDFGVSSIVTVELGEQPCVSPDGGYTGTTLGQRFTYDFAPQLTPSIDHTSFRYFQPLVRDIFVPWTAEVSDPFAGWAIYSFVSFPAKIGELVSKEVVSNYLAYYSGAHDTSYHQAIVIRVDEDVQLPEDGLALWVDRSGYSVSLPTVHAIHIGSAPASGSEFFATVGEPLNAQGYIGVHVTGVLVAGDNVIAFGDPAIAGRRDRSLAISGPFLASGSSGNECPGDGSGPSPMDVMTDPNGPFADSGGDIPESSKCDATNPGPPFSNCIDTGCKFEYLSIGEASSPCGVSITTTVSQGWSGGVTVGFKAGIADFSLKYEENGSVSGQVSVSVTVNPGWRVESFIGFVTCTAICDKAVSTGSGSFSTNPGAVTTHETVGCMSGVQVSSASCQFSTCGT